MEFFLPLQYDSIMYLVTSYFRLGINVITKQPYSI